MDRNDILDKVGLLIKKISENDKLTVTKDTQFSDIENWDSLNTVDLEMDIETDFNIEFDAGEFQNYRSIDTLVEAIKKSMKKV